MSTINHRWIAVTPKEGKQHAYILRKDIARISIKENPGLNGSFHLYVTANGEEYYFQSYDSAGEAENEAQHLMTLVNEAVGPAQP